MITKPTVLVLGASATLPNVAGSQEEEEGTVNSPHSFRLSSVRFLLFAVPLWLTGPASAQRHPGAPSLQGVWRTAGYGTVLAFQGDSLHGYEVTTVSCLETMNAARETDVSGAIGEVFTVDGDVLRILPGPSPDTRWLSEAGTISNILLRRTGSFPPACRRPVADTPLSNYRVYWATFAEQYAFFALRRVDWSAVDREFRPHVTPRTTPQELFQILRDMTARLHDAHTYINAPAIKQRFRGRRSATDSLHEEDKPRVSQIIATNFVRGGLRDFCKGQLQFGLLRSLLGGPPTAVGDSDAVGYLRIHSFARYASDPKIDGQLDTLDSALDQIFANSSRWSGLVIDVRINSGGSDELALAISARLASRDYLAYRKAARDDIHSPGHHTPPSPILVHMSRRPGFHGRVVVLTSAHAFSAAETFTMSLLGRQPHAVRIGTSTQGVFSDELDRTLPNGWTFGLSNETYLSEEGRSFEGVGIPPDSEILNFSREDMGHGRDSALNKALELLAGKSH